MDEGKVKHKISTLTFIFMLMVSSVLDGIQVLLTLSVLLLPISWLIAFLAICIFALWNAMLGVNYFSGKKKGIKMLSVVSASIIELVPIVDAIPGISAGVIGVFVATRMEERKQQKQAANKPFGPVRFGPGKISLPTPANDTEAVQDSKAA